MSKNIILIGAGGLGKEVFHWFNSDDKFKDNIKGFLDRSDPDFSKFKIKPKFLEMKILISLAIMIMLL